ncbi:MAG: helicase-associated domain-containing protein, partial [Planctomycetes bacterium]|nr:helicase-associated domain-containing protein [Planctomycetota bacterium]
MKAFDIDWTGFLRHAAAWQAISFQVRRAVLLMKPSTSLDTEVFGDHGPILIEAKILETLKEGYRIRPAKAFAESLKALRQMDRIPLFRENCEDATIDYLRELLTAEERSAIVAQHDNTQGIHLPSLLSNPKFLQSFLDAKSGAKWEENHIPDWTHKRSTSCTQLVLTSPTAVKDLRFLIKLLKDNKAPMSFVDLIASKGRTSIPRLGNALWAGLRYGLLFADLDEKALPRIGLNPEIHARDSFAELPAPKTVQPEETGPFAYAIQDLIQVLVFCSEPRRLRTSDNTLFAKAEKELAATLIPFPAWDADADDPNKRIHSARWKAQNYEFLEIHGRGTKNLRIETSKNGHEWMSLPAAQRAENFLTPMRVSTNTKDLNSYGFGSLLNLPSHAQVVAAFKSPKGPVLLHEFMAHQTKSANPLFKLDLTKQYAHRHQLITQTHLEESWEARLEHCIYNLLLPYGGLSWGHIAGQKTIELTPIGRYLLNVTDTFDWPQEPESSSIVIQPDFEVLFLSPNPVLEAVMTRFAERIGTGLGALFRLTKASIQSAARAQQSVDDIRTALTEASGKPLPKNVALEIETWHDQVIHMSWQPAQLLHCPDETTALRILSASKGKLELLGPTTLALFDVTKRTTLTNTR